MGSNIDPEKNLRAAAAQLKAQFPAIRFSNVYASAPMERADQSPFLNAVAKIETDQSPTALKSILESIESLLKKSPPFRFGPRTIDLDLLLFDDLVLPSVIEWQKSYQLPATSYQLLVPHPKIHLRRFVLAPLCELIDPAFLHPVLKKPMSELLDAVRDQECKRTDLRL